MELPSTRFRHSESLERWFSAKMFALVLGLLLGVFFWKVICGLEAFVVRDFGFFSYPLANYHRDSILRGELPLWNPLSDCGVPFLAQWNTLVLYPLSLIYIIFDPASAVSVFGVLHLFIGGLGMYFLARGWTKAAYAGAFAGIAFAFGGVAISSLQWTSQLATQMWMPWVILTSERAWQRGGRSMVWSSLAGACQMLCGAPETILLTWVITSALWVSECWCSPGARRALFYRFAGGVLLVAGLAAAQLLPFLELVLDSQRGVGFADTRWSMPAWGAANLIVPLLHGHFSSTGIFFQHEQAWISSYYLGIGTLFLAIFGALFCRNRRVLVLGVCGVAALILASGDNTVIYRGLRKVFPFVSLMTFPIKYIVATAVVGPLLAAFGLAAVFGAGEERQVRVRVSKAILITGAALGVLTVLVVWFAWKFPLPYGNWKETLHNGVERTGFMLGAMVVLVILSRSSHQSLSIICLFVLLLTTTGDLMTHVPKRALTVPKWVYQPGLMRQKLQMNPQPELGHSRAMLTPYAEINFLNFVVSKPVDNFLGKRLGYFANCNLLDAVPKVDGFFPLSPSRFDDVNTLIFTNQLMPPLMDFLSASQITAPGKLFDWVPRATFLPFVTAGQNPVFIDPDTSLKALSDPDWNPRQTVFLEKAFQELVSVTNQTRTEIISSRFASHRVEIEVEAAEASLIVISQTFYRHWRAFVDGEPAPLLRANHAFQAVQVPTGRHKVNIVYHDTTFRFGVILSCFSLAVCGGIWRRSRQ